MSTDRTTERIYSDAIVIDGLNVSNWRSPAVFENVRAGGFTAINATSAIWEDCRGGLDAIAAWMRRFSEDLEALAPVRTVDDIRAAKAEGKLGIIIGWQNASPIENDLDRLAVFHGLGVRVIQITYNERNLLGNGCYERSDGGLSRFGVDAIKEMNRLGILVDLSHVGDQTTLDAAEASEKPVSCTHANARAFFDHVRNKTDDALQLIAERGGVIGANAFPAFFPNTFETTLAEYVDAIEDLVDRVGIDHVAIGTDYTLDQPKSFFDWLFSQQGTKIQERPISYPDPLLHPAGIETPDKFPSIAGELLGRGYGEADIRKILGENWLRIFGEVWT
ncbi:MAG: dipeptidase [Candidatus Latescibacteria bacterium]|jgi:membrane dipeptidase|nr:dipeptidase [Candidatus Latescibacterota bacterium]